MNVAPGADPQHQRMVDLVVDAFEADACLLFVVESDGGLDLVARCVRAPDSASLSNGMDSGLAEQAVKGGRPTIESGERSGSGLADAGSEMAAPLRFDGEVIGAISVHRGESGAFSQDDLDLLAMLANHAAMSVVNLRNNRRSETETARFEALILSLKDASQQQLKALDYRARCMDLLNRVMRSLTGLMSIDELLHELLHMCAEAFELSNCALLLKDENNKVLVRRSWVGYDEDAPIRIAFGEGITGHVALTGVPILINDVTSDPRYITGVSSGRAEMAAPLRIFGEVIGVLDAESIEENAFDEEDLDLFTSFAAQAAVAIMSADLTAKLEKIKSG